MPDHICLAGLIKSGGPYWTTVSKKANAPIKEREYQDYQCRYDDCSTSIPVPTGNTR